MWDNSHIGKLNIIHRPQDREYIIFEVKGLLYSGVILKTSQLDVPLTPLIAEVLKVSFGIKPTGTVRATMKECGSSSEILIQRMISNYKDETPVEKFDKKNVVFYRNLKLTEVDEDILQIVKTEIQRLYLFRDSLNITPTYTTSIVIRVDHHTQRYQALSINENNILRGEPKAILSKSICTKWFDGRSVQKVMRELMPLEDLQIKLFEVSKTILEIEPKLCGIISVILTRVTPRYLR